MSQTEVTTLEGDRNKENINAQEFRTLAGIPKTVPRPRIQPLSSNLGRFWTVEFACGHYRFYAIPDFILRRLFSQWRHNPKPYGFSLVVYANETVVWKAKTLGTKNVVAIFFPNGTPFADQNGRPMPIIVWSAKDVNSPTATVVEQSGSYDYSVAAYDEDKGKSYTDDPKIIVGNGGIETDERVNGRVPKNSRKDR